MGPMKPIILFWVISPFLDKSPDGFIASGCFNNEAIFHLSTGTRDDVDLCAAQGSETFLARLDNLNTFNFVASFSLSVG